MLKSFLLTALRSIARNKFYGLLNITSLTIGLTCFALISLHLYHELSFDRHHKNARNIYRVVRTIDSGEGPLRRIAACPSPLGPALKLDHPDLVLETVRMWHYWGLGFSVRADNHTFYEVALAFVDSTIFRVFDFEFIEGLPAHALRSPYSVVLSQAAAVKYFGTASPIGKTLRINDGYDVLVTAVISDMPATSHFHFDFLVAYSTLEQLPWRRYTEGWDSDFCYTYVLLDSRASPAEIKSRFVEFFDKHLPPAMQASNTFALQPLLNIHLHSNLEDEFEPNSNLTHNLILLSIALFILVIAILNYVNLTTAYYLGRGREIAVRRIFGSRNAHFVVQFIGETGLFCLLAMAFSLLAVFLLLPLFSRLAGETLAAGLMLAPPLLVVLLLICLLASLLAGSFLAYRVAVFHPAAILGGALPSPSQRTAGRKWFVSAQIAIATFLITGAVIIHQQRNYIDSFDVGFDENNIIIVAINQTPISGGHFGAFLAAIQQHPGVISATGMRSVAGYEHIKEGFRPVGASAEQMLPFLLVRYNFVETFGLRVIAGRDFSANHPTDEGEAILINESLADHFGWNPKQAIGRRIRHRGWGELSIIGVIGDFNFESLHTGIKPLVVKLIWPRRYQSLTDYLAVRLAPDEPRQTLQFIQHQWQKFAPNHAFDYAFLSKRLDHFYSTEQTLSSLSSLFSLIAIGVACLGLLGLVAFTTRQRVKEIAVRKVLGASVASIFSLILREFVPLILGASLLAWPFAYWAGTAWLHNFAYRIEISGWIFLAATALVLLTSFLAIVYHTLRSAWANPVAFLQTAAAFTICSVMRIR